MDLSKLPEEMLEVIAQYLNLEDICSCSEVSIEWKTAFNTNRIWKRFDTFNPCYFDKQSGKLNYKTDDRTFEQCDRKKRVLKGKFVEKNMFNGNYIVEEIDLGTLYCESVMDFADSVGNHWLFASCMEGNRFEGEQRILVWNLNDKPLLHTSTLIQEGVRFIESQMKVIKEKFYFINGNKLLVYKFAYPLYDLEFVQNISLGPTTVYNIPFSNYPSKSITGIRFVGNTVVNFFKTPYHDLNQLPPSFIAWNLENSVLLKGKDDMSSWSALVGDPSSFQYRYYFFVETSIFEKVLVPVVYLNPEVIQTLETKILSVKIFDVELVCYTDFYVQKQVKHSAHEISLHKTTLCLMYIDISMKLTAECYNIQNNNILFNVCVSTGNINFLCQKLLSEAELMVFENKVVHLFNIFKKKEINSFKIEGKHFGALTVLNKSLILLECVTKTVAQEIWNVRTGQKLYTINFSMTLGVEQFPYSHKYSCTPKIIMFKDLLMSYAHLNVSKNKVYIISFW